ncbi:DUF2314 domain-containing protein [Bowmanella denitrificans]|uniref:DUF2314 domain-containing protein n=1 Tax=Bowmanella denitrificans TaxID=366582 RepID=UPI001FEABF8C|nr:DUF2314 domain-containing protein [Bowmanella denitrificans]
MMRRPTYGEDHYVLHDAEELHHLYPDTFLIPDKHRRESLEIGALVKLIFSMQVTAGSEETSVERMWVEVTSIEKGHFVGRLDNQPYGSNCVVCDQVVYFQACHVIDIYLGE